MVVSGLTGDALYVKPTKLALHFIFADRTDFLLHFGFHLNYYFLLPAFRNARGIWVFSIALLVLVFIQMLYGALMAGNKAAAVAPTWPRINGDWIPDKLFTNRLFMLNFIANTITIHFMHRNLAYLILLAVSIWTVRTFQIRDYSQSAQPFAISCWACIVPDSAWAYWYLLASPANRGESLGNFRLGGIIASG